MFAVYTKMKNYKIPAPSAWFIGEDRASDYAEYLKSNGKVAKVVPEPDIYLEGKENGPAEGMDSLFL